MAERSRFRGPGIVRVVEYQPDHQVGRCPARPRRTASATPVLSPDCRCPPGRTDRAVSICSDACDKPCVDLCVDRRRMLTPHSQRYQHVSAPIGVESARRSTSTAPPAIFRPCAVALEGPNCDLGSRSFMTGRDGKRGRAASVAAPNRVMRAAKWAVKQRGWMRGLVRLTPSAMGVAVPASG